MVRIVLALLLVVSAPAFAEDPVTIALHVNEPVIDTALLGKAIADGDPLTRATAAGVGRLQSLDLSKVTTIGPCKTALKSMLRLSLSKWKFKPGTLDGQPVDVLFNVTVSLRH